MNALMLANAKVLWGRMASFAPVGNRRWTADFVSLDRRVTNPPQVVNLPHKRA
jgi:hypothetical protein